MLQIQNLTLIHRQDLRTMVENFTFTLQPGDKAVIIGEEGNGKSTLLQWIYNPALVEDYVTATGKRILSGAVLGYLPQELSAADQARTVYEFFSESPVFWDQTPRDLARLSYQLGLPEGFFYFDQPVRLLSGGEKIKMQLCRIVMETPDILLLDEPSNDIDIETLEWLENFINQSATPVLYVSHDETLIERTANVIIHLEKLERGRSVRHTISRQDYRSYITQRLAGIEKQTQLAYNEEREYKKQMQRFYQIQQKVEHQQSSISRQDPHGGRLLKKKMKAVKSQERRFEKEHETRTQVPHTELAILASFDPSISLPAGKTVVDFALPRLEAGGRLLATDVSLRVTGPEKVCIIGQNGCGKSTLMKALAETLLPRRDIHASYMPQNYEDLLDLSRSPIDYLAENGDKEEITRIRTHLGSMRYTPDEMFHPIRELSGGQKAKILFLKMIFSGANVLLLDEPTRNFSPLSSPVIRRILKEFGGAIISISHDRKFIEEVADSVYRLSGQGLELVSRIGAHELKEL